MRSQRDADPFRQEYDAAQRSVQLLRADAPGVERWRVTGLPVVEAELDSEETVLAPIGKDLVRELGRRRLESRNEPLEGFEV